MIARLFTASSSSSSWYFLSNVGLESSFIPSLYKRRVADEDLSISERSPQNNRNRRKICRNVQFTESMGRCDSLNGDSCFNLLPRAGCSCLYTIINLNSIYVYRPNDQRSFFEGTGSRFSACLLIKMMFFCRNILYRLWKQYDHVIIMSKKQTAHSPGSYLINLDAISCKLINHGIKPWGQQ